jgi:hypothetical protein
MKVIAVAGYFSVTLCCAGASDAETLDWIRQLGTSGSDASYGVSADGLGNIYTSGHTGGSLEGTSAGGQDAFVSKYNSSGTLQWTRQFGTTNSEGSYAVSADGLGNVYISGHTDGSLVGTSAGLEDAFVSKYDDDGNLQWTRQLGTSNSDGSYGVSADGLGSVYISGFTAGSLYGTNAGFYDAFVSKYDEHGNLQWIRQLGTSVGYDYSFGVSADGLGNAYISGVTPGSLEGTSAGNGDAYVSKYDADGNLQWIRQLGTSGTDEGRAVSADGLGNVYISGDTSGSLDGTNAGSGDAFVSKYDADGNLQWTRQFGTSGHEYSYSVSADALGNVYMSGHTPGSLEGTNAGAFDAYVRKYDADGNLQWTRQLGTTSDDESWGVSADGLGSVYISGWTYGGLEGRNAGDRDIFVAKFSNPIVPEPGTLVLAALGCVGLMLLTRGTKAARCNMVGGLQMCKPRDGIKNDQPRMETGRLN